MISIISECLYDQSHHGWITHYKSADNFLQGVLQRQAIKVEKTKMFVVSTSLTFKQLTLLAFLYGSDALADSPLFKVLWYFPSTF